MSFEHIPRDVRFKTVEECDTYLKSRIGDPKCIDNLSRGELEHLFCVCAWRLMVRADYYCDMNPADYTDEGLENMIKATFKEVVKSNRRKVN